MTREHNKARRWQFGLSAMFKAAFVTAAMLGAGIAFFPVFDGHPVTTRKLNQVQVGMTKSQVKRILGSPSTERPDDWRYHGRTWCFVVVKFDDVGRVTLVEHDH